MTDDYVVTFKTKKLFGMDIQFASSDLANDIKSMEEELVRIGISPLEGNRNSTFQATPAPSYHKSENSMNNISENGEANICPMHKMPMDRVTKSGKNPGTPYHSYKGKNCSGEGWWGERPQAQA